jgi:cellulose synthase/poly-beta-1,6-N-acetylglucosamine synthase-like glycosyltransferase
MPHPLILIAVTALWMLAILQGIWSLVSGLRFYRFVSQAVRRDRTVTRAAPRATVILPCCGVDDRLEDTVRMLGRQNYPVYEVVFTFESSDDPAYAAVGRWTSDWTRVPVTRAVSGQASACSQKIHNLLAAVKVMSPESEVLAFLDSDVVPHTDWLADLTTPLSDPQVGAATGFRWYSSEGTWVNGLRSAWNAASITFIYDEKLNFCWGGSTAIRRETFERLGIAERWRHALSDDYQVTRAVREAGLRIRFVPRCLLPSPGATTLRDFLAFARRQLIITRVCAPAIWKAGLAMATNFITAATATLMLAIYAGMVGQYTLMAVALAGWGSILILAGLKALIRQIVVRHILTAPHVRWADMAWDVLGVGVIGMVHLGLLLSTARTRRIVWRSRVYEMVSPDETRVLDRSDALPPPTPSVVVRSDPALR